MDGDLSPNIQCCSQNDWLNVDRYETQTDSPHVLDGVVDKTAAPMDNGFTLRHLVRPSSGTPTPVSACIANTCIACMCKGFLGLLYLPFLSIAVFLALSLSYFLIAPK